MADTNMPPNIVPPSPFQPDLPNYPEVSQLVRVASGISGGVYPGFVQQYAGSLSFRDREACYVLEPNGITLNPGRYDCRLVGSLSGLPLFAATCCVTGASSFTSTAPTTVPRVPVGYGSTGGALRTSLAIEDVSLSAGLLRVNVSTLSGDALNPITVAWGATTLTAGITANLPGGAALVGTVRSFYAPVAAGVNDLTVISTGVTAIQASADNLVGYTNVLDVNTSLTGLVSAPDSGSAGPSGNSPTAAICAVLMLVPSGAWGWGNSFTSGGQDVGDTVSGVLAFLAEGYRLLATSGAFDGKLTGMTAASWAAVAESYK